MAVVLGHPALYEFTGGRPPSVAALTDLYGRQTRGRSADSTEEWSNWVVRVGGTAVGYVQATVQTDGHTDGHAEVAWVIGVPWQGRGYATAATLAMLDLLRDRGVTDVAAYVRPGHTASEAVAARVGLVPTGKQDPDGEQLWTSDDG
jgi:RimJ/RimL family protein N-acetyltransferase